MITLISREGDRFKVNRKIEKMSQLFSDILEDNDNINEDIPLLNIPTRFLRDIIQYCK